MGKAKDGSECYTRQNKSGGSYVTCEGTQNKRTARRKLKSGGEPPVLTKSPQNSARARGRRSAAARKLTTRPEAAGRIETGIINPGVVMPEGASASFEGLFGSVAPEPVEDDQDINEDILSEVIPGLFEGMGSGVPVGDRPVYAGDFLDVLNVMSETGRETGKSTAADIDERVKLNREAREGKLDFNDLFDYMMENDDDFMNEYRDRIENVVDSYTWGSDFYRLVKRVTKRDVDTYEELTDRQQERFSELIMEEGDKDHYEYLEGLFNKVIKGKKFGTVAEAAEVLKNHYYEN